MASKSATRLLARLGEAPFVREAHGTAVKSVNYFPHLSKTRTTVVSQERQTGYTEQGRDLAFHRHSMSDPDVMYRGPVGNVYVVEGGNQFATPEITPLRHSLMEPGFETPR